MVEYGSNHGVFETSTEPASSASGHLKRVSRYHQKEKKQVLQQIANEDHRVLTDGDFFMASDVCEALYEATASYDLPLPEGELCCWTHFFDACTPASDKNNRGDIKGLFKALEKFELFALDVSSAPSHFFSHVGTLPEYLS